MEQISEESLNLILKLKRRRMEIEDPDYWRRLNPECSITDQPFPESPSPYPLSAEARERNLAQIRKEGYFQTEPLLEPAEIARLRRCIVNVVSVGKEPLYAMVYDEFYHVMAKLTNVLSPFLGPDFQLVPDEYGAYYIAPDDNESGSAPHRDILKTDESVEPDGTPTIVNVWIPLTDATTLNSCIYVLPADADPHYPHRAGWATPGSPSVKITDLQCIRALPAQAGSVLCWSTHLIHWGARSSIYASEPRISFATYYQNRRVSPYHEVTMDIPSPLSFARRLYLIESVWHRWGVDRPGEILTSQTHLADQTRNRA